MEATEIIEYVRQQHLTISLSDDGHLELSPAEKITNKLIGRLRKHKSEIIEELKREQLIQQTPIKLIQSWLYRINEPEEDHSSVLDKCRNNPEAMEYFLKHARGEFGGFNRSSQH